MDSSVHGGPLRRKHRESESEDQRVKREKAAERQRRKRERDRTALQDRQQQQQQQAQAVAVASGQLQQPAAAASVVGQGPQTPQTSSQQSQLEQFRQDLTPEEISRREKVRLAARDRQRKHRALVKQRRLRELGLDMGNDIMPGMEEPHYRAPDGQYHQVLPPELQQLAPPPPNPIPHEPPFPHGAPLGGQTFASTLLLSFSCAPLLKQHLLRTLGMTNEELVSLEPLIAEAWDRWDHQRRLHYAEVAKNGGQAPPLPPPYTVDLSQHETHPPPGGPFPHASGSGTSDSAQASQAAAAANDFRARFHRSIAAPTPFQTANSTPGSTSTAPAPAEGSIDPHLGTTSPGTNGTSNTQSTNVTANGANKKS